LNIASIHKKIKQVAELFLSESWLSIFLPFD